MVRALAGLVRGVGPAEAPVMLSEHQSFAPAALSAFSAALASLIGGTGRRYEISAHDASVLVGEFQDAVTTQTGFDEHRWGRNHFFPVFPTGVYPTKEGWLGVTAFSADQWRGFCDMLGVPELVSRPGFTNAAERLFVADELDAIIEARLAHRTAREWADEAIARRAPLVVTPDMATLLATQVHRDHGAFGEVADRRSAVRGLGAAAAAGPGRRQPPRRSASAPAGRRAHRALAGRFVARRQLSPSGPSAGQGRPAA